MRAGQMRQLVTIQNPVTTTDNTGQDTYSYSTVASKVPAEVRNISQRKTEDGVIQGSGQETYTVKMRYTTLINYNTRLLYNGQILTVMNIQDQNELRHVMNLRCELVDL